MRIIVCGGRGFMDFDVIINALDALHSKKGITMLIEGGAKGAESHAATWADQNLIPRVTCNANWNHLWSKAGPMRNKVMLSLNPDGLVAFPGNTGTASMMALARADGVMVWEPCK